MNDNLIESFDMLEISDKRDQIYNELSMLNQLIKEIQSKHNIDNFDFDIKNYIKFKHDKLDESEFLTYIYEDIYLLVKKILIIASSNTFN